VKLQIFLAGVPDEIRDAVLEQRGFIAGEASTSVKVGRHGPAGTPYQARHIEEIIDVFKAHIDAEAEQDVGESGFAVIYVRNGNSDAVLERALFPFLFLIPEEWTLIGYGKKELAQSKNQLVRPLHRRVAKVRESIDRLTAEFSEQAQRTPWLLPVRNFDSDCLCDSLRALQTEVMAAADGKARLTALGEAFRRRHPPQRSTEGHHRERSYFVDDSGLMFKPPGHHLHGFHRPTADHTPICAIGGKRRLGAPYRRAFHYDCIRQEGKGTEAQLFSCHSTDRGTVKSEKNINIAPNDYTRPEARK